MKECVFCSQACKKAGVLENEQYYCLFDLNPVTKGHMLIVPKEHKKSFFDFNSRELELFYDLLKKAKQLLSKKYFPDGYNIGINNGKAAGQTITHLHIHLMPRYFGDTSDPRGGVRNIIPKKGNYLKNRK
ncbi:MAG: HIT family protein [Candidatus ainarchaeum sp.]|nr:HIT family protein [Candidatus ainarchaeum sp.]